MKIYVASSWRNEKQPLVVDTLLRASHDVYDFRNPEPGDTGFAWSEIDPDWKDWSVADYRRALQHPLAVDGLTKDERALREADAVVLVTPCGASAHLEFGYGIGAGKLCVMLIDWTPQVCYEGAGFQLWRRGEPELMYGLADAICDLVQQLPNAIETLAQKRGMMF